ncbi:MAG: DNA-3-methyladenine glycosylase I [Pseudomonadota bacterium]
MSSSSSSIVPAAACPWPGDDPAYRAYHDLEWGRAVWDSNALFEKFVLDSFQAGLSWLIILRKREALRKAFANFDLQKIARFSEKKVTTLMADTGIVRNRAKILATIRNAQIALDMADAGRPFGPYLWDFVDGIPVMGAWHHIGDVPAQSALSRRISKDMKQRGFSFCGPTIIYAFAQAVGIINDHLMTCPQRRACFNDYIKRR